MKIKEWMGGGFLKYVGAPAVAAHTHYYYKRLYTQSIAPKMNSCIPGFIYSGENK
jgi:hypothetical protein